MSDINKKEDFFTPENIHLMKSYLTGGAMLGGGSALVASLVNYMNRLRKDTRENDDDTLYVHQNTKSASVSGGLALTGLTLGGVASYALVKKLYNKFLMNEAQKELDDAQRMSLGYQGFSKTKKPKDSVEVKEASLAPGEGRAMTVSENILSAPVLLPLLLGLGAGVTSYKFLDKTFPLAKTKVKQPRRIEIVDDEQQPLNKEASAFETTDADALELLMRTVASLTGESDTKNIIKAAASGELKAFKLATDTMGYMNALDTVKGAYSRDVDPLLEHMSTAYLAKSARLSANVALTTVADFNEAFPLFVKMAAALPEDTKDDLYNIYKLMGAAVRFERSEELGIQKSAEACMNKQAAAEIMGDALDSMYSKESDESSEEANTQGAAASKHKVKIVPGRRGKANFLNDLSPDMIDKFLDPRQKDV